MANILIVEDSPVFRRTLRGIFESAGHRVVKEVEEGQDAIEAYNQGGIDLISMDIQLPGMDGIETVRRIREQHPEALIIMITSHEQRDKVVDAIKLGAKHYITKPFTDEKVIEVLNTVLRAGGIKTTTAQPVAAKETLDLKARPVPKQDVSKLEAPTRSAMPFELEIIDGRPELTITRHISDSNVRYLHSCLQGLLYYRKAKYVLVLAEPVLHEEGMQLLQDFISTVWDRKGTIGIVTDDPGYYTLLQAKFRHGVYRSRDEIDW